MKIPNNNDKSERFQSLILQYLDAAYNYSHWLTRNRQDAADLTQEAMARAYAAFDRFEPQNAKAWLFTIIRNTFLNDQEKIKQRGEVLYFDTVSSQNASIQTHHHDTPESILQRNIDSEILMECINTLSHEFRETLILKELEGLRYEEIATITGCPIGTVMSRLSRARTQLKGKLVKQNRLNMVKP